MKTSEILSALSNPVRLNILTWLKDPSRHFPAQNDNAPENGICVTHIQEKTGLSQSTISLYLATLQRADLVRAQRVGQWTYYSLNREVVAAFIAGLAERL